MKVDIFQERQIEKQKHFKRADVVAIGHAFSSSIYFESLSHAFMLSLSSKVSHCPVIL